MTFTLPASLFNNMNSNMMLTNVLNEALCGNSYLLAFLKENYISGFIFEDI